MVRTKETDFGVICQADATILFSNSCIFLSIVFKGWETARHPDRPSILVLKEGSTLIDSHLSDWAVLKLGKEASNGVARVILDTKHFRGNYPESAMLEGCYDPKDTNAAEWFTLIPRTGMSPDAEHVFEHSKKQLENSDQPVTHVRVSMYPDGGISRVRIYG
jgi:allantoicase